MRLRTLTSRIFVESIAQRYWPAWLVGTALILMQSGCQSAPPKPRSITAVGQMQHRRSVHTATLLPNGRVLMVGGKDDNGPQAMAELYDPDSGKFRMAGALSVARFHHTATLLADGRVLIAGGATAGGENMSPTTAAAELYDPATGTFQRTGDLTQSRSGHTATLLPQGKVLIVGGSTNGGSTSTLLTLDSVEIYDVASGKFTRISPLTDAREGHTATLLQNGQVLIAGGMKIGGGSPKEALLFDPRSNKFKTAAAMTSERAYHSTTLLQDGRVLLIGGVDNWSSLLPSAEFYNPANNTFTAFKDLIPARKKHTATLLQNGTVFVYGFTEGAQLFVPEKGSFETLDATLDYYTTVGHTATLLNNGQVLIAGGDNMVVVFSEAGVYTP